MLALPRLVAVVAALTLICTLASGGAAQAAEKAIWGPASLPDGSSALGLYAELGVDTVQLSMSWASVASERPASAVDPSDPAYRWPNEIDVAERAARSRGIQVALLVASTPPWANGGRAQTRVPDEPQDYADFLTAAARRYPTVRRWMIWGEPNRDDRLQPNTENGLSGGDRR